MPKFIVTTRTEVERVYEVDAADAKSAEAASTDATPMAETDIEEETLGIVEIT